VNLAISTGLNGGFEARRLIQWSRPSHSAPSLRAVSQMSVVSGLPQLSAWLPSLVARSYLRHSISEFAPNVFPDSNDRAPSFPYSMGSGVGRRGDCRSLAYGSQSSADDRG